MQKIVKNALPARFKGLDLKGWSVSDMKKLSNSSKVANDSPKNAAFRLKFGIDGVLYPSEKQIILTAIASANTKELASVKDVHQHYLDREPVWLSEIGMKGNTPMKADAWLVPPHLESTKPAVPQVMGMVLAMTDLTPEGIITAKEDFAPLLPFAYHHVDVTGMAAVAPVIASLIEEDVKAQGKIHGGRDAIDKLTDVLNEMPKEDYLMVHYMLSNGPFVDHFHWAKLTEKKVKSTAKHGTKTTTMVPMVTKKPGFVVGEVILSVKAEYADHWADFSDTETVKLMKTRGEKINKVFVWGKGFVPSFLTPQTKELTFATAHRYMGDCRNFRGTDDNGLSGWSCGFGASGNPTKIQSRLTRKLSVVLGSMMEGKTGPVIVEDYQENELVFLKAYIDLWQSNNNNLRRVCLFKCPPTSVRVCEILGSSRYVAQDKRHATHIIFPEIDSSTSKGSEWSKTDAKMQKLLDAYFPPKQEDQGHTVVCTLLLSKVFFQSKKCAVFTFGSNHNMLGYLSNKPLVVASASGQTQFEIVPVELKPLDPLQFLQKVCAHNGHRTGYFLNPQYYFNPQMNFLRHIPGKTMNFDRLEVEDVIGASVIQARTIKKDMDKQTQVLTTQSPIVTIEEYSESQESEEESERSSDNQEEEQETEESDSDETPTHADPALAALEKENQKSQARSTKKEAHRQGSDSNSSNVAPTGMQRLTANAASLGF
jgi:hypothetical protein